MSINDKIKIYLDKNNKDIKDLSKETKLDEDKLKNIINGEYIPSSDELKIIDKVVSEKMSSGKKAVKIVELILRFGACIMALVTLLLCINGNVKTETLIALLSIGLVCSSIISLPKIEK
jgi:hypothetical protein